MLNLDTTLTFFAASVMLALVPGPDNVFVLLHSAAHGWRSGLLVVLGLCTGLMFHTAAVALGLAALMASSSTAFTALTLLGAMYLLWLAWQSWNAPVQSPDTPASIENSESDSGLSTRQTYARGVLMNITNPKVAIFFLAFCPNLCFQNKAPLDCKSFCSVAFLWSPRFLPLALSLFLPAGLAKYFKAQREPNRF